MRQTLHIFKKDARHLRWEIALVLAAIALDTMAGMRPDSAGGPPHALDVVRVDTLPLLAWFFLIVRAIQSEALPGTRQFWITRPYSWKSLLAAKILFMLVFVTLPMTIADAAVVTAQGFPATQHLAGLLWFELLRFTQTMLPLAVLAAISATFTLTVLWIAALILATMGFVALGGPHLTQWGSLEWIRDSGVWLFLVSAMLAVLIWQYRRRGTLAAQAAIVISSIAIGVAEMLPPEIAYAHSAGGISQDNIKLDLQGQPRLISNDGWGSARVTFDVKIDSLPPGLTPHVDAFLTRLEDEKDDKQGHTVWHADPFSAPDVAYLDGSVHVSVRVDRLSVERWRRQRMRLRSTWLISLYRDSQTFIVPLGTHGLPIPAVGLCEADLRRPIAIRCRSAFRHPAVRVAAAEGMDGIVYTPQSPYPAEGSITPLMIFTPTILHYDSSHGSQIPALTTEIPQAHLLREVVASNIVMDELPSR